MTISSPNRFAILTDHDSDENDGPPPPITDTNDTGVTTTGGPPEPPNDDEDDMIEPQLRILTTFNLVGGPHPTKTIRTAVPLDQILEPPPDHDSILTATSTNLAYDALQTIKLHALDTLMTEIDDDTVYDSFRHAIQHDLFQLKCHYTLCNCIKTILGTFTMSALTKMFDATATSYGNDPDMPCQCGGRK